MPVMTARSTCSWDAATVYPVNALEFDPERCEPLPGANFVGAPWPAGERAGPRMAAAALVVDLASALSTSTHAHKTLLGGCGMKYTGVGPIFALSDTHFASGDIYAGGVTPFDLDLDIDGTGAAVDSWSTTIKNCVGGVTLDIMPAEIPQLSFSLVGQIDPALATVAATAQATVAGQWAATTITSPGTTNRFTPGVAGTQSIYTAANLLECHVSTNPRIAMRRGLGTSATAGHGYFAPAITGYNPQIDVVVEVPAISSTTNPKPVFLGDTVGTWTLNHTFSSGNTFTLSCTNWKIASFPTASEKDGILVQSFTLKPARAAVVASGLVWTWAYS